MLDPLSTAGIEMVEYVKLFLDHLVPARVGIVLLPDPENKPAVAICQGFAFLVANLSPREGLRWLMKVCSVLWCAFACLLFSYFSGSAVILVTG